MLIKEAKYKTCKCCKSRKCVADEQYGCDTCKKPVSLNGKGSAREYLDVAVFSHAGETTHHHFCSWKCCIKFVRKISTDYFVTLPFLAYDEKQPGLRVQDFLKELKP